MVRPKASDRNKTIAVFFANTVTVDTSNIATRMKQGKYDFIVCRGPHSIYGAMRACLPNIVRDSMDEENINRTGLAEVEMNKSLLMHGYKSIRRRGLSELGGNMQRGWQDRRWVDPTNIEDVQHVKDH